MSTLLYTKQRITSTAILWISVAFCIVLGITFQEENKAAINSLNLLHWSNLHSDMQFQAEMLILLSWDFVSKVSMHILHFSMHLLNGCLPCPNHGLSFSSMKDRYWESIDRFSANGHKMFSHLLHHDVITGVAVRCGIMQVLLGISFVCEWWCHHLKLHQTVLGFPYFERIKADLDLSQYNEVFFQCARVYTFRD